jgi:predicted ester cyclase
MSDRIDPKALIVGYFEDVWNARQLNVIDEVLAPIFVGHERNAADTHGPAGMHQVAEAFFHRFPDAVFTILDAIAEGDMVVLHLCLQATHRTSGRPITLIMLDKPHRPRYPEPILWPYRSISTQ